MTLPTPDLPRRILNKAAFVLACALSSAVCTTSSFAQQANEPQWCNWKVSNVWTAVDGMLYAYFKERGDHIALCNLRAEWKGVPKEACRAWNQYLTVASLTKKVVVVHYTSAPACAAIPYYSNAPAPVYVMLTNPD
jgi:hypothetical protein